MKEQTGPGLVWRCMQTDPPPFSDGEHYNFAGRWGGKWEVYHLRVEREPDGEVGLVETYWGDVFDIRPLEEFEWWADPTAT